MNRLMKRERDAAKAGVETELAKRTRRARAEAEAAQRKQYEEKWAAQMAAESLRLEQQITWGRPARPEVEPFVQEATPAEQARKRLELALEPPEDEIEEVECDRPSAMFFMVRLGAGVEALDVDAGAVGAGQNVRDVGGWGGRGVGGLPAIGGEEMGDDHSQGGNGGRDCRTHGHDLSGVVAQGSGVAGLDGAGVDGAGDEAVWQQFTPAAIDAGRCLAREWGEGRGAQCKLARKPGQEFCGRHRDVKTGVEKLAHGRVDGRIPEQKLKEFLKAAEKRAGQ